MQSPTQHWTGTFFFQAKNRNLSFICSSPDHSVLTHLVPNKNSFLWLIHTQWCTGLVISSTHTLKPQGQTLFSCQLYKGGTYVRRCLITYPRLQRCEITELRHKSWSVRWLHPAFWAWGPHHTPCIDMLFWFVFSWQILSGLPRWLSGKESACQCRFNPWVGKIPWRREWQPTPVFLLVRSHGQWSLVGYRHMGLQKSQTGLSY